jgi:excisionase family DNA binding protein
MAAWRDRLPLKAASRRLRGKPGRPRKTTPANADTHAGRRGAVVRTTSAPISAPHLVRPPAPAVPVVCPPAPASRLLGVTEAARYLAVSRRTVTSLLARGDLHKVELPGPGGQPVRRVLLDRAELDHLIDRWRQAP